MQLKRFRATARYTAQQTECMLQWPTGQSIKTCSIQSPGKHAQSVQRYLCSEKALTTTESPTHKHYYDCLFERGHALRSCPHHQVHRGTNTLGVCQLEASLREHGLPLAQCPPATCKAPFAIILLSWTQICDNTVKRASNHSCNRRTAT